MENSEKPGKVSAFVKAALGLLLTAIVDVVVSFSTSYWATWTDTTHKKHGGYGLWKFWKCQLEPETKNSRDRLAMQGFGIDDETMKRKMGCEVKMADNTFPAWYVASQVLQTLGLAALVTSVILVFVFMFVPKWTSSQQFLKATIAVSYSSGIFTAVSLFVFGFKVAEEVTDRNVDEWALSWSFSIACVACLLTQIAASVLVSESKRLTTISDDPNSLIADGEDEILPVYMSEDEKLLLSTEYECFDDLLDNDEDDLKGILTT